MDADDIVLELDIDTMSVDMAMDEWDDDMAYDAPSPSYEELLEFVTFSPIELWFAASPSEYAPKWKFKDIMIEGDALITLDEKTMTQKELQEFYPVIKELFRLSLNTKPMYRINQRTNSIQKMKKPPSKIGASNATTFKSGLQIARRHFVGRMRVYSLYKRSSMA